VYYRKFVKLISTYIDKLPEEAAEYDDKRVHCHFLQVGAETGRVACKSPKMIANWASKIRLIHGRAIA
jgi:DNA polymerase I-like protein with 3'-5' exonuclease and polymerase domains